MDELPIIGPGYQRQRMLRASSTSITYAGLDPAGDPVDIVELFPVDIAQRDEDGTVRARGAEEMLLSQVRQAYASSARVIQTLRHPDLVPVDEIYSEHGTVYLVGPMCRVTTLARALRRAPLDAAAAYRIASSVLVTLEDMHASGFIHGNVNPHTILLGRNAQVMLGESGHWRATLGPAVRRLPGALIATGTAVETVFPERFETGAWTDVFGLASSLQFALTGLHPHEASSRLRLFDITGNDVAPRLTAAQAPRHFREAVHLGLALLPDRRPPSIQAWRPRFSPAAAKAETPAANEAAPTAQDPAPRSSRRISAALANVAGVVAVVVLAALATVGLSSRAMRSTDTPSSARLLTSDSSPQAASATSARPGTGLGTGLGTGPDYVLVLSARPGAGAPAFSGESMLRLRRQHGLVSALGTSGEPPSAPTSVERIVLGPFASHEAAEQAVRILDEKSRAEVEARVFDRARFEPRAGDHIEVRANPADPTR